MYQQQVPQHQQVQQPLPPQQRILVRTCNGLELRDPPYLPSAYCNSTGRRTAAAAGGAAAAVEFEERRVARRFLLKGAPLTNPKCPLNSPLLLDGKEDDDDGDFPPPFSDHVAGASSSSGGKAPLQRAKSSLSHHSVHSQHSFRSTRSFQEEFNNAQ